MRFTQLTGMRLPAPVWHILQCRSGQERRLSNALQIADTHCCYPTREAKWRRNGKTHAKTVPEVPGYVFAKFTRLPVWHIFRARNLITGVVSKDTVYGPAPYIATEDDVRQFMGIPTEAEEAERKRIEAMQLNPMDQAFVLLPGDVSLAVIVTSVSKDRIWWESATGMKGEAEAKRVTKAA